MKTEFTTPYAAATALGAMAAHAVPGLEECDVDAGQVRRLILTPSGPASVVVTLKPDHVAVEADSRTSSDFDTVVEAVRRWLGLDSDLAAVESALGGDPMLAPLLAKRPGLRVMGDVDGFETAILTVLGQQVSLAAARTFGGRMVAAYGRPVEGTGLSLFPTPERVAAVDPGELQPTIGLTQSRNRTILALAAACANGLSLSPEADRDAVRRTLLTLPGVGPWTVEYLALRVLRDADAFPADDLVLKRAMGVRTAREARERAARWAPYRAFGVYHLWADAAYG